MGFTSHNDLLNNVSTLQKCHHTFWNKLTHSVGVQAVNEWNCLFHSTGNPQAGVLSGGTNLSFQSCCDQSAGAIDHGGIVSPATKHLISLSASLVGSGVTPQMLLLVDLLGYYPMSTITVIGNQATIQSGTATFDSTTDLMTCASYDIASFTRVQVSNSGGALPAPLAASTDYWTVRQSSSTSKLATTYANAVAGTTIDLTTNGSGTNTATAYLPRYTSGVGVQTFVTCNAACGSATPDLIATYTAASGATGHVVPSPLPLGKTTPIMGMIPYSGSTGANGKFGPFMPLVAGDTGILKLEQINIDASYVSGSLAYCLARPIAGIPIANNGVVSERDFVNQIPSLPRIYDGACLMWLMGAGVTTPAATPIYGKMLFGWGP
jgi:hypothetical protein